MGHIHIPSDEAYIDRVFCDLLFVESHYVEDDLTFFSYNGKKYVYDEENTLFVVDDDGDVKIVGTWDPETKKPVFSEDAAADDDDDDDDDDAGGGAAAAAAA